MYTRTTKERLEALEIQKDELTAKIADEKLKKPSFNEDFIRFWLMKFRKFDISQKKQRKALIEIFVNAIFLYDDRMLITFNYKDGTQTVRFEDTLTADCGEKSLRLRSNESPSGAFEQQNGLAQARWRGLAPTSSDLSSLTGPFKSNDFTLEIVGFFSFAGWPHLVLTTMRSGFDPRIRTGEKCLTKPTCGRRRYFSLQSGSVWYTERNNSEVDELIITKLAEARHDHSSG